MEWCMWKIAKRVEDDKNIAESTVRDLRLDINDRKNDKLFTKDANEKLRSLLEICEHFLEVHHSEGVDRISDDDINNLLSDGNIFPLLLFLSFSYLSLLYVFLR